MVYNCVAFKGCVNELNDCLGEQWKWCSADRSWGSTRRNRLASSGRAVALPRNLIAIPRTGFTTATARRYHSPFSTHAKEKSRWDSTAHCHNTNHQMKKRETRTSVCLCVYSCTSPGLLIATSQPSADPFFFAMNSPQLSSSSTQII